MLHQKYELRDSDVEVVPAYWLSTVLVLFSLCCIIMKSPWLIGMTGPFSSLALFFEWSCYTTHSCLGVATSHVFCYYCNTADYPCNAQRNLFDVAALTKIALCVMMHNFPVAKDGFVYSQHER